jgi:hypothetical protein
MKDVTAKAVAGRGNEGQANDRSGLRRKQGSLFSPHAEKRAQTSRPFAVLEDADA